MFLTVVVYTNEHIVLLSVGKKQTGLFWLLPEELGNSSIESSSLNKRLKNNNEFNEDKLYLVSKCRVLKLIHL